MYLLWNSISLNVILYPWGFFFFYLTLRAASRSQDSVFLYKYIKFCRIRCIYYETLYRLMLFYPWGFFWRYFKAHKYSRFLEPMLQINWQISKWKLVCFNTLDNRQYFSHGSYLETLFGSFFHKVLSTYAPFPFI